MNTLTLQHTHGPVETVRPEELRGRSAGVIVGAVFGLIWDASTRPALSSTVWLTTLLAGIAISVALMFGALRLRHIAAQLPVAASGAGRLKWRRHFTFVVAGEWLTIIAAVNIVATTGRTRWIPAVICAAVGVHFAPLGHLFKIRLYYLTAASLCALALATLMAGMWGAPAPLWTTIPGLGAASTLWATSTTLLIASNALARRASSHSSSHLPS